ncbi:MAG TPA: hypothetical protein DEV97_03220 [Lachnospiraceae bacterium]|nr:hypothetical protein [Lachnospiraceae bacterium]
MTNTEAIELLDSFQICVAPTLREAMSIAISALQAQEQLANNSPKLDSEIDRQSAIDAVKRLSLGETDVTRFAMRIGDYLERLPSAQPELPWIPCKKQLPVEEDAYFVTVDPRYVPPGYRSTDVITWHDGKWVMADYFVLDSEGRKKPDFKVVELSVPIIAWMPLPKEYQEDE